MNEEAKELLSEAVTFFKKNNFDLAEKRFKQALDIEPENALIHNNYAMLLKRVERYEEAEKHYKTALEIEPTNVKIKKNYGSLLRAKAAENKREEEKHEKAKELAKQGTKWWKSSM